MTLWAATRRGLPPLMRVSAAVFAAAAFFGVLRFTGLHPEAFPHQSLSMLTGVAAFPALAFAAARPASRLSRELWAAVGLTFAQIGRAHV